jgi:hypothetical protein
MGTRPDQEENLFDINVICISHSRFNDSGAPMDNSKAIISGSCLL